MQEMIKGFLSAMTADGKSKCTVSAYSSDLKEFSSFVNAEIKKPVSEISPADLRKWANNLEDAGLSASSRARKISAIKSFFSYLLDMEYIQGRDPSSCLKTPKLPKKKPKVISSMDARNLLDAIFDRGSNRVTYFRDYTIIATFLFTGIRREELTNITLDDLDMERDVILIHGKGDKERIVYINENLRPVLSEYMISYRRLIKTSAESKYLFPSSKNEKMSVRAVSSIVDKAMNDIGIKESGIGAHVLRKWFATTAFKNTGDIATTSKLLGHSSPTVTMRYVNIEEETMRKAAASVGF